MADKKINLMLCDGVEGVSCYLNDYRIIGNKPWAGGKVITQKEDCLKDLKKALEGTGYKIVKLRD